MLFNIFNEERIDNYSYDFLNLSEELKVYTHSYHIERQLVKNKYGRLFHYSYDEEMSFCGGDDREGILWKLVTNDANSDELSRKGGMGLLREPNVVPAETNWVAAHEFIEK